MLGIPLPGPREDGHEGEKVAPGHILREKAQGVRYLRGQALLKNPHSLPPHLTSGHRNGVPQRWVTLHCSGAERSGCLWTEQRAGDQLCNLEKLARQPCDAPPALRERTPYPF